MPRHYRMEVYGEMTFTNVDNQRTGIMDEFRRAIVYTEETIAIP